MAPVAAAGTAEVSAQVPVVPAATLACYSATEALAAQEEPPAALPAGRRHRWTRRVAHRFRRKRWQRRAWGTPGTGGQGGDGGQLLGVPGKPGTP
ncbi:hypothetical protein BZL30_2931 [Mycobacterium kansasii]|uniref:Uncharacterized protein n=1 Tax=Mycobacterium kansasii TaxID=1768 RepID=A0A1V3XL08_MYCKA|nr:hypothetical protein BZL30_2931 [Mycobacterium kansasii]